MKTLILASILAMSAATLASAQTIYNDTFSRTGPLAGSSPAPTDGTGLTWQVGTSLFGVAGATSSVTTDGSVLNFTSTNSGLSTATLGLTIAPSTTYTATLDVDPVSGGAGEDWLAFGFTASDASQPANGTFYDGPGAADGSNPANPQIWGLYKVSGALFSFNGGSLSNEFVAGNTGGGNDTFTLTFDSGSGAFSIKDSLGGINQTGTLSAASVAAITGFGVGNLSGNPDTQVGTFGNLTISAVSDVPEPSSLALVLTGAIGLVTLIRFRKASV
jgi:hypothetical protein